MAGSKDASASLGLRVKTARAIAVSMTGTADGPQILERRELQLFDDAVPDSKRPFHVGLDLPKAEADPRIRRASEAIYAVALQAVRELVNALGHGGFSCRGVGLVVGSITDPATLGNPHVRAHAAEGALFREALEDAAQTCGLSTFVLVERTAYVEAGERLGESPERLKLKAKQWGAAVGKPWRADEKTAALAAWVALKR